MHISDTDQFKTWLTKSLEPICEADPCALAKYIIALLKKNKNVEDLKLVCTEQLIVFLKKNTEPFITNMFETLQSNSYLNQDESQIKSNADEKPNSSNSEESDSDSIKNQIINKKNQALSDEENSSEEDTHAHKASKVDERVYTPTSKMNATRTRNRWDCNTGNTHTNNSYGKDKGKYGSDKSSRDRIENKNSEFDKTPFLINNAFNLSNLANLPLFPSPDILKSVMNNQLFATLLAQNQKALNIPKIVPPSVNVNATKDEFHSSSQEETFQNRKRPSTQNMSNVVPIPKYRSNNQTRELILRKVPSKNMNISIVNEYFSEFGQVTNVMLNYNQDSSSVLVEFATPTQARKAFESSKAIFGNRFIKTFLNNNSQHSENSDKIDITEKNEKTSKKSHSNSSTQKYPSHSELHYVNPDILIKNQSSETDKAQASDLLENEEDKKNQLEQIETNTKDIMTQLKSPLLTDVERSSLRDQLKKLMAEKDSLTFSNKKPSTFLKLTPSKFKQNKRIQKANFHLDNRPRVLSVTLNKFSNSSDIIAYFEKYGKVESSKITDSQLLITYASYSFAAKALEDAELALGNRIDSIRWLTESENKAIHKTPEKHNTSEDTSVLKSSSSEEIKC